MNIRVHKLAKELGMTSKVLLEKIRKLGVNAKGHMSALDEETAEIIRHEIAGEKKKAEPEKKQALRTPQHKPEKSRPEVEQRKLRVLEIDLPVTIKQLSVKINAKANDLIKRLMKKGILLTLNQNLSDDIAIELVREHGYEIKEPPSLEDQLLKEHKNEEKAEEKKGGSLRAPIVTLMGHVDHGKTSLLDYIRKTKIAAKEKGGITQHIGAYEVNIGNKGRVTFLDTPGHQAFTAMRARGANATDIVVLVVAADDGIMPQTIEAIDHAKAAKVPIIVAINKCDLANISLDKIKKQLSQRDLTPEEWGGKTITLPVSAKTGEGVDRLLEMLLLEAELLELNANVHAHARGVVVEGRLSPGQGTVATILVKNGTLKVGDIIITGFLYGKVKAMINDRGKRMIAAPPATPVEILGLSGVPEAGDEFFVVKDEKKARTLSILKQEDKRLNKIRGMQRMSLEDLYKHIKDGTVKELKVIIKGDVQGSVEALKASLEELSTEEVKLVVIHMGVGNVNESDVMLSLVSSAIVIGFHVKLEPKADKISKKEGLEVKLYNVIYEAIADIKAALEGLLEPIIKEIFTGRAQVRQVFHVTKVGTVAGCYVAKGAMARTGNVRLILNKKEIFKGKIKSLKHLKDDVKEAREGFECGIALSGHNDIKTGDLIESFRLEKIIRRLEGGRK